MTEFWDLVRHPPSWILAILLTILVSHLIKKGLSLPNEKLIPILEFFVVVVLGGLTIHVFLGQSLFAERTSGSTPENPNLVLASLLVFTLISIGLYLLDKRSSGA
jgi:hypothetical protein